MAMTLGLTACASDEYTIERIRFGGSDSITLTDAEAADEKGGTAAFEEAVAELPLRVYADESRNFITGADCSYDVSGITWGAVGNYTATLTPEKNNPDKLSIELNVVIGHDFGEPDENGLAVCKHCGKSESTTTFETPVVLNYDAFHNGPSAESTTDPDGLIKPFGTVDQNGVNVEVPTYSVGKLRKGMTLSVTGTAQSMASEAGSASSNTWFYPVLGFAMREFDPTTMASSYSTAAFSGGASVLVRNDGWLLLNGIGESPRLLAGFAGGAAETYNYGTVPGATLNAAVAGYDPNKMPSSAGEWKEWYTYSTGTQLYTLDYQTKQNITLSWEFREDNVIVMTNRNDSMGTSLVSYVRVPDSMADYTFDTVLHGEYINMEFTSISAVESDRLAAATAELAAGAKRTYVEGESLNLDELSVRIAFESAPTAYEYTTDYTVQAYVGSETTAEAAQADTATESWTEVTAETPLSSAWRFFRIRTIVGGSARYAYLNVGYSNFLAEIAPNSVDDVQPVRIVKGENAYLNEIENMLAYGELTYAAGTANSAAAVSVAITGVPDRIPAAYGVKDYSSFVALRLYAQDGKRFGTPSVGEAQSGYVFATRGGNGAYVDVLVYLNQNVISKGVTLNGIQSTPVFFDLSGLTLPAFSSAVEGVDANGMLPLNKGGDVTVTYTLPGLSIEDARADHGQLALVHQQAVIGPALQHGDPGKTRKTIGKRRGGGDPLFGQRAAHLLRAFGRAAPQHYAVSRLLPRLYVGQKVGEGPQIPAHGGGGQVKNFKRFKKGNGACERLQRNGPKIGKRPHPPVRNVLPGGKAHHLARLQQFFIAPRMLFVQPVQLIGDQLALVEYQQRFAPEQREHVADVLQQGQNKIVCAVLQHVCGDRAHALCRGRRGSRRDLLRQAAFHALALSGGIAHVGGGQNVRRLHRRQPLARHLVIGLYAFYLVAEKVDADGMFAVDGINIQHVAAHRKRPAALHRIFTRVAARRQRLRQRTHVRLLSRLQSEYAQRARRQLYGRLDIAHQHFGAALPRVQRVEPAVQRLLRARLTVGEHLVFGGEQRAAPAREALDRLRRPLCGKRICRYVRNAPRKQRGDQVFLRVGGAEHGRRRAVCDRCPQQGILPAQRFKRKKPAHAAHPLYLPITRSIFSPRASATAASAARRQAAENRS